MTVQITLITLVWLVGALAVTVAVGLAIVFFLYRARVGTLSDQIRSARYVFDYDNALEWVGVGLKERQALLVDLRRNIADAAADGGVSAALDRIGPARELARSVAIGRKLPKWPLGLAWGIAAAGLIQSLVLVATDAFFVAAEASGADALSAPSGLLAGVTFYYAPDGFGAEFGPASWWMSALPLVAFVIGSRAWRALTNKAARRAATV